MATINTIGIGSSPNDGTGDTLRDAFNTCNTNFTNLNTDKIESSYVDEKLISKSPRSGLYFRGDSHSDDVTITSVGNELSFGDGTNDFPFSIFAVVDVKEDNNTTRTIVSRQETGTIEWNFAFNSSGNLALWTWDDSSVGYLLGLTSSVVSTGLHSLCATYDGSGAATGIKIYIDGVEVAVAPVTVNYTAMEQTSGDVTIGRRNATDKFKGVIYDVQIYNRLLSSAEVANLTQNGQIDIDDQWANNHVSTLGSLKVGQMYRIDTFVSGDDFTNVGAASNATGEEFVATGTTPTTWTNTSKLRAIGCVWAGNFQAGAGTTLYDKSGKTNDGEINGARWISKSSNILNSIGSRLPRNGLRFAGLGSGDEVSISDNSRHTFGDGTNDYPFSIYSVFKCDSLAITNTIVARYKSSNKEWLLLINSTGGLGLFLYDNSASEQVSATTEPGVIRSGHAHSIVCTYDGTGGATAANGIKVYVDSIQVEIESVVNDASYVAMEDKAGVTQIGRNDTTLEFNGVIYDLQIYNRELSETEAALVCSHGQIDIDDQWADNTTATAGTLTVGQKYRIDTFVSGDDFTNVGAASNATGEEFVATGTTPTTWSNSSSLRDIGCVWAGNFQAGSGGELFDKSFNQDNGLISGPVWQDLDKRSPTRTLTKIPRNGLHFDGSNDAVTITDGARHTFGDGTNDYPFSIAGIFKSNVSGQAQVLCGKWGASGGDREWVILVNTSSGNGRAGLYLYDESASVQCSCEMRRGEFIVGQTNHIAITYDGSGGATAADGIKIYVNGNSVPCQSTNNASYVAMEDKSADTEIGKYDSVLYYGGDIYDLQIFNRELSAGDINDLFEEGQIDIDDQWADNTTATSGTLTVGQKYRIDTFVAGDDFTNVGAASNATGVEFVATGTTPTTWTNSSSLRDIGCVWAGNFQAGAGTTLYDKSTNVDHGSVTGAVWIVPHEHLVEVGIAASDETTDLTTGDDKVNFRMPFAMRLHEVRASVSTAPTTSGITVDIEESGTTILSTKLTIDATEKTSTTAATPAVISDVDLADDAEISINIDAVGSGTAGAGLKVWLIGTRV